MKIIGKYNLFHNFILSSEFNVYLRPYHTVPTFSATCGELWQDKTHPKSPELFTGDTLKDNHSPRKRREQLTFCTNYLCEFSTISLRQLLAASGVTNGRATFAQGAKVVRPLGTPEASKSAGGKMGENIRGDILPLVR